MWELMESFLGLSEWRRWKTAPLGGGGRSAGKSHHWPQPRLKVGNAVTMATMISSQHPALMGEEPVHR